MVLRRKVRVKVVRWQQPDSPWRRSAATPAGALWLLGTRSVSTVASWPVRSPGHCCLCRQVRRQIASTRKAAVGGRPRSEPASAATWTDRRSSSFGTRPPWRSSWWRLHSRAARACSWWLRCHGTGGHRVGQRCRASAWSYLRLRWVRTSPGCTCTAHPSPCAWSSLPLSRCSGSRRAPFWCRTSSALWGACWACGHLFHRGPASRIA